MEEKTVDLYLMALYKSDTSTFQTSSKGNLGVSEEVNCNHTEIIHPNIEFTMEKEIEGQLLFLDVVVICKADLLLGHKVYSKPTHTDRYLHKNSNHHSRQKRGIIKTLVDHANQDFSISFKWEQISQA